MQNIRLKFCLELSMQKGNLTKKNNILYLTSRILSYRIGKKITIWRDFMELYDCINFILNSTQNAVHSYFRDKLQPFGVTPIQYSLLKCLWEEDTQTPSQLAQTLQVDSSTVTGLLERLERKQLIVRRYSQEDRRSVFVCLEEGGRKLQDEIEEAISEANAAIMNGMTAEEIQRLKDQCGLMKENARSR